MTKVLSGDLSAANTNNMATFEYVIEVCTDLITQFNDFEGDSPNVLIGGGYDAVRTKLELYINALNVVKSVCTNLISNIKNANNSMINYMEGYSELDDAQVPEYRRKLQEVKNYLDYLISINGTKDSNGNVIDVSSEIAAYTQLYEILKHYLELLEGLSGEDASLFDGLSGLISDIENICSAINGINETTFTADGMKAIREGKASIYNIENNRIKLEFPEPEQAYDATTSASLSLAKSDEYQQRAWEDAVRAYCEEMGYPIWSNFGDSGCGTCTAAEIYTNLLGQKITPLDVISEVYNVTNGQKSKSTSIDTLFGRVAERFGVTYDSITCSRENVNNCISAGGQVATAINGGAHYISIVDYNPATDQVTVFDSYYTQNGSGYRTMSWDDFRAYKGYDPTFAYAMYKI